MRPQVGVITELRPDWDIGVFVDLALAGEKRFGEGLKSVVFKIEKLGIPWRINRVRKMDSRLRRRRPGAILER